MIKYSLQNECLENIEAYSDEQMNREMAVIESVLEIYDKTILMMELSNSDVDVPDCSMFMESTFFQEQDPPPAENNQSQSQTGGEGDEPTPPAQNDQQQNNGQTENNTQKTPPTEAERKKYNSQHQFRQMNKKGNIENMFISIIAFIPRLFGFLIQSIVKLFKKIGNKKADNAINNTDKNLSKLSDEQKSELAAEISKQQSSDTSGAPSTDSQGQNNPSQQPQNNPSQQPQNNPQNTQGQPNASIVGKLDVVSGTYTWWDQSIGNFLENCKKALESINFSDPKKFINNSGEAIKQLSEIVYSYLQKPTQTAKTFKFQNLSGSTLVKSKNFITQKLEEVKTLAESKSKESEKMKLPLIGKGDEKRYLGSAKESVKQLKSIVQRLSGFTTTFWIGIERAANNALAVENLINGQQQPQTQNNPSQQSSQTGQPQIQQPQPGGENNGEQSQNNQPNA